MRRVALCLLFLLACDDGEPARLDARPTHDDPHADEADSFPAPSDDPSLGAIDDASPPTPAPATPMDAGVAVDAGPKRADSPVPGKVVTYPHGVKNSRYAAGYHTGEDYAAPVGTPVVAVRSGVIKWSNDNGGAYGKWMGLEAENGRTYVYCHLSTRLLSPGAKVVAGAELGKVGATGNVTGPHLHFEDHPHGPFVYAQVRKPEW